MFSTSSSSFDDSNFYFDISTRNSSLPIFMYCFISKPSSFIFTAYSIINILLLLPLCIFMLYIGLHQCHPTFSTTKMHHSDIFGYNMVIMLIIGIVGSVIYCCGLYGHKLSAINVGCLVFSFSWYGQATSHILLSMNGYLATVHPITYLRLGKQRGKIIRIISIICNWLIASVGMGLVMFDQFFIIMDLVLLTLSFAVIFFCGLSVLCALIRPSPGEQGRHRKKIGQLKQRVFITMAVIKGVLLLKFAWNLAWVVMFLSGNSGCLILMGCTFSSLPSSLVLPLLFVRREGKLSCCNNDSKA